MTSWQEARSRHSRISRGPTDGSRPLMPQRHGQMVPWQAISAKGRAAAGGAACRQLLRGSGGGHPSQLPDRGQRQAAVAVAGDPSRGAQEVGDWPRNQRRAIADVFSCSVDGRGVSKVTKAHAHAVLAGHAGTLRPSASR